MATFLLGKQSDIDITSQPVSDRRRRAFYLVCAGLCCLVWLVYIVRTQVPVFPYDDSYIAVHSAQTVWAGREMSFPGGHALDGITSIVHIAFLSSLMAILPPLWALSATQWLALIAYVLGLGRLAFVNGANLMLAAAIVVAGTVVGLVPHHLQNGMETGLALAGLTWALVFATDVSLRDSRWTPLLWVQLPFLRPELIVVTVLLFGIRLLGRIRKGETARILLAWTIQDMVIGLAGALPWLLWYRLNTGSPIPSSMSVKLNFFAEACWPAQAKWTVFEHPS